MEKLIKELEDKVNRTEKNLTKAVKKNEQLEEKLRATEGELQVRPAGGKRKGGPRWQGSANFWIRDQKCVMNKHIISQLYLSLAPSL